MRMFIVLLALSWCGSTADAQWFRFDPIVRSEDVPDGHRLGSRLQINDAGQALYMIDENPQDSGRIISRIYLDGELLHEGGTFTQIGDLNDNGQFSFTELNGLYTGDSGGAVTEVVPCVPATGHQCDFIMTYQGVGPHIISSPRIDGDGTAYFLGSSLEQMTPNTAPYRGEAGIYVGPDPVDDVVFGEVRIIEAVSDAEIAVKSWDVNEHGDILIGDLLIPHGEQSTGHLSSFDLVGHVSLNNLGQSTQLIRSGLNEAGLIVTALGVADPDGFVEVYPPFDDGVRFAFINDQQKVAFQTGSFFSNGVHVLDIVTKEMVTVLAREDKEFVVGFQLHDYNDEGQMAIEIDGGLFLVTPSDSPLADLDFDGRTTAADINRLFHAISVGSERRLFDVNADGLVSAADADHWVSVLANTAHGDADVNGVVDFSDFLSLSSNFAMDGGWSEGDFDGSGDVNFADFLLLSDSYGFERVSTFAVPEPHSHALFFFVGFVLFSLRKF